MDAGYTPHQGHSSTDYSMTWLGRRAELRTLGVPVRCRAYKPSRQCNWQGAVHYKETVQGLQLHTTYLHHTWGRVAHHSYAVTKAYRYIGACAMGRTLVAGPQRWLVCHTSLCIQSQKISRTVFFFCFFFVCLASKRCFCSCLSCTRY